MTWARVSGSGSLDEMGAGELARCIKAGEVSSQEVAEAHIRRIEAVNRRLNAVVIPLFEEALAQAKAADGARARHQPLGPLHGVPMTIKEQFRVAGTQTTLGLPHRVGKKSESEGPLVQRLRKAGAIILGKTNVPQLLLYYESDNPVYGRTNNPWNPDRTPGGSSGGEAAIIAAGGSPLGLGGDLGGSLRVPAHFCGIHSLKPTSGRLTNDDNVTEVFPVGQEAVLAQQGPLARTVADLRLAMEVLAAPGSQTTTEVVPPVPWPDPNVVPIAGLRVGMYTDDAFFAASPAVRRAVEQAAAALRARGAHVEPFSPPDVATAVRLFLAIIGADAGEWIKRALGNDRPERPIRGVLQGSNVPAMLRPLIARLFEWRGQKRLAFVVRSTGRWSASEYWRLVEERNAYRRQFLDAMDRAKLDALICPPHATPALSHGSGAHLSVFSSGSYAVLYNVVGLPAGVVAATRVQQGEEGDRPPSRDVAERWAAEVEQGSAGLPAGVQVAARHWREDVVLAVMEALEEAFRAKPDYPARQDMPA